MILKTYFVKDVKLDELRDVMSKYYFEHLKKFNSFTVRVSLKVDDEIQFKLSVPHIVSYGTIAFTMTVTMKDACDFLDRAIKAYSTGHEIEKKRWKRNWFLIRSQRYYVQSLCGSTKINDLS